MEYNSTVVMHSVKLRGIFTSVRLDFPVCEMEIVFPTKRSGQLCCEGWPVVEVEAELLFPL